MEMSPDWLAESIEWFRDRAFVVELKRDTSARDGAVVFQRTTYVVTRAADEHLSLELIQYPDAQAKYYLEVVAWHGLRTFSFELDSWRHRDDQIEFKYYDHPETGAGLSFTLRLPKPARSGSPRKASAAG